MVRTLYILTALLFATSKILAQADDMDFIVEKGFVIISSTQDYQSAFNVANEAANKIEIELNLRDYYYDEEVGLKTDIVCGCGMLHDYIPRGRWDDGAYISIEYSNMFHGFTKGYYIVVVASGSKDDEELMDTLKKAQSSYADAYLKYTSVYIGCMH